MKTVWKILILGIVVAALLIVYELYEFVVPLYGSS